MKRWAELGGQRHKVASQLGLRTQRPNRKSEDPKDE